MGFYRCGSRSSACCYTVCGSQIPFFSTSGASSNRFLSNKVQARLARLINVSGVDTCMDHQLLSVTWLRMLMPSPYVPALSFLIYVQYLKRRKIHWLYKHYKSFNSRLPKSNFDAVTWRYNNLTFKLSCAVLPVPAYTLEALKYSYNCITYTSHQFLTHGISEGSTPRTHLSQRELLSNADPRPAVERYISPGLGRPLVPPLRTIL